MRNFIFLLVALSAIFFSHCKSDHSVGENILSEVDINKFKQKGKSISTTVFSNLSNVLQSAIQSNGVKGAITYCNLKAIPIVDSLSTIHKARIRRTSTKYRNNINAPTDTELIILTEYEKMWNAKNELHPMIKTIGKDSVAFYAPILTNQLCLQCHGTPGNSMKMADYYHIKKLYPNDLAIDYKEGDLRGAWSIIFSSK